MPFTRVIPLKLILSSIRCYSIQKQPTKKLREKMSTFLKVLDSPEIEKELNIYRKNVKHATDLVEKAKKEKNDAIIKTSVIALKRAKEELQHKEYELMPENAFIDQITLYHLLTNRFFFDRSYTGHPGLIDLGPLGVAIKNNIIKEWRKSFVTHQMMEVETPSLTPTEILKASGHVDRFTDFVVRDTKTNEVYRADHLVREHLEAQLGDKGLADKKKTVISDTLNILNTLDADGLNNLIIKYTIKSNNGNEVSSPTPINLMFAAQLGSHGVANAYLRPETAQGIFLNFRRLLAYNGNKLPFSAVQIGTVYRNEIAPKHNLFRLREFTLCEIEHFYDPKEPNEQKLDDVMDVKIVLWSSKAQELTTGAELYSIRDALESGILTNHILAYYLAQSHLFLTKVGIDPKRLRFRQHRQKEMAHYARDCWDAEALTSVGWIEVSGFSDRSSFDLRALSQGLNINLNVEDGNSDVKYPEVIEPSFGLGRILQTVFEHSFRTRDSMEPKRPYFMFPPTIAPVPVSIYPIVRDKKFDSFINVIQTQLNEVEIPFNVSDSRYTIGKRYARMDETGVPFGITVDDETEQNGTVTVREISSMGQIRVNISQIGETIRDLTKGRLQWGQIKT